jgi:hypothetical protein
MFLGLMGYILTELKSSICLTAAAAAADACAFFLLAAADATGTTAVAVEEASVEGAAAVSEPQGALPLGKVTAPPAPVDEALGLLELAFMTVAAPLLLIT